MKCDRVVWWENTRVFAGITFSIDIFLKGYLRFFLEGYSMGTIDAMWGKWLVPNKILDGNWVMAKIILITALQDCSIIGANLKPFQKFLPYLGKVPGLKSKFAGIEEWRIIAPTLFFPCYITKKKNFYIIPINILI